MASLRLVLAEERRGLDPCSSRLFRPRSELGDLCEATTSFEVDVLSLRAFSRALLALVLLTGRAGALKEVGGGPDGLRSADACTRLLRFPASWLAMESRRCLAASMRSSVLFEAAAGRGGGSFVGDVLRDADGGTCL